MAQVIEYGDAGVGDAPLAALSSFDTVPYVELSAIFAGTVVALAVDFVLSTFGVAVGLSSVSPWTSTRATVAAVSYGAAFWMMLVHIWSFALGGYLAARMRHRHAGAAPTEVEFRDGAHGAIVWGLGVTIGAIVAAYIAAAAAHGGAQAAGSAAISNDPMTIATDSLMRTTNRPATATGQANDTRGEIGRILMSSNARTGLAAPDRTYLSQLVAARTGVSTEEADKRVDTAITNLKLAADKARKTAVMLGFVTAATLLLGAAAAWWGGVSGGKHRDDGTIWAGFGGQSSTAGFWS